MENMYEKKIEILERNVLEIYTHKKRKREKEEEEVYLYIHVLVDCTHLTSMYCYTGGTHEAA